MFTGIIEKLGEVKEIEIKGGNKIFTIISSLSSNMKVDQSLAHNGVCLTIIDINNENYKVEAIEETLDKSNLGELQKGDLLNLERATILGDRLDGHIVQGHTDTTGICKNIKEKDGSKIFTFEYNNEKFITVEKGSITINGVSLTVFDTKEKEFSVAIIPYTLENTNFKYIKEGSKVNLEFDIIGKYIEKLYKSRL